MFLNIEVPIIDLKIKLPFFDFIGPEKIIMSDVLNIFLDDNKGGSKSYAPEAEPDHVVIPDTGIATFAVLDNDTDKNNKPLTISSVTQPSEGIVTVNPDGTIDFDTDGKFAGLSEGEEATVSFTYTANNGLEDSNEATVEVTVLGEGIHDNGSQETISTAGLQNERSVTASLITEEFDNNGFADFLAKLTSSELAGDHYNIAIMVDTSGSVGGDFQGTPVGDLNNDGKENTILDAEIAAIQSLNQSIQDAGFTAEQVDIKLIPYQSYASAVATEFDPDDQFDSQLETLVAGGGTNFESPLQAALSYFEAQPDGDVNLAYFLSDGYGSGAFTDEAEQLHSMGVQVNSIAIGSGASLTMLDQIDNTDGAQLVTDTDSLQTSLTSNPIEGAELTGFSLFVNGQDAGYDIGDLSESGLGYSLAGTVTGLDNDQGSVNNIYAVYTFDDGTVFQTDASEIIGVMPAAYADM